MSLQRMKPVTSPASRCGTSRASAKRFGVRTSCNSFRAFHASKVLRKNLFTKANGLGGHFNPFVFVNPLDALFERELANAGQGDEHFGMSRANIGELFLSARIDVQIVILAVLPDDHSFVDGFTRSNHQDAAIFE